MAVLLLLLFKTYILKDYRIKKQRTSNYLKIFSSIRNHVYDQSKRLLCSSIRSNRTIETSYLQPREKQSYKAHHLNDIYRRLCWESCPKDFVAKEPKYSLRASAVPLPSTNWMVQATWLSGRVTMTPPFSASRPSFS